MAIPASRRAGRRTLLAVTATLLGALLWVSVAGSGESTAHAQLRSRPNAPPTPPNAATQRKEILKELREVKSELGALKAALSNTTFNVRVANFGEMPTVPDAAEQRDSRPAR